MTVAIADIKVPEEKFDLILLDLVLPEISGMDVLKKLRKSEEYGNDSKVIIFSNLDKREHEKEARENGADGFISKSEFNPSKLVVEVQRLLKEYDEQKKNKDRLEGKITDNGNGNKKILFIEDEEIFLEMFGKKLEDEGYDVDNFCDSKDENELKRLDKRWLILKD